MGLEIHNDKLFGARTNDLPYIEVRAKVFIKRFLCKIFSLYKESPEIDFTKVLYSGSYYHKGMWIPIFGTPVDLPGRFISPMSLLKLGIKDIRSGDAAINARIGLQVCSAVTRGFSNIGSSYPSGSLHGNLFFGISRYILYLTTPKLDPISISSNICSIYWRQYIDDEWNKLLTRIL